MKDLKWTLLLGLLLIGLSITLYFIHFLVFQDPHHIGIYLLGDIAFLPIEVLLVTLILHRLLETRDTQLKMEKLNMVIGTFFSSLGTWLLTYLSDQDPALDMIRKNLILSENWTEEEFNRVSELLNRHSCEIDRDMIDFAVLKPYFQSQRDFMLRLLENPILLEHEEFTDLLRAVFHLTEELEKRPALVALPANDRNHLVNDTKRVYRLLIIQWLEYMRHLKNNYPYLFSLAMRTNPFDDSASPVIP